MIHIYLSCRALAAARAVEPLISPAAVHAAVEVTVAEQLLEAAGRPPDEIRARAQTILRGESEDDIAA